MKSYKLILIVLFFLASNNLFSQTDSLQNESNGFITIDTTSNFVEIEEFLGDIDSSFIDTSYIKSPKKAVRLSAAFPGLGQIYNEKYWKVPIVWGMMGVATYGCIFSFSTYIHYINDYIIVISNTNPDPKFKPTTWSGLTDKTILKEKKLQWRKYRDYCVLGWIGFYTLNIVDAYVDAQFSNFDVSEDLSFNFSPTLIHSNTNNYCLGLNFSIKF